ncbi:TetR/AcrR family transcriptional regulator [Embleya scabrispora]|uniref:TetR/AcrR family transcriptional regulator n=1 Tax=Embleya scabrispora TaxID=159449 RepID=UPI000374E14C|nr:TetR/AcrR family transcriptional regulator [Embleya scabrispora]MYS80663.1 TetR family transcriptional regulator [Streptomyces sp. SID5474]
MATADSIWLRPERAARGPAPGYDRDTLAAAGVTLADAHGLAAVTMRAVADALGAGPASLYRYIATREELVELMVDRAHSEIRHPEPGGDWLEDLLGLAHESRRVTLAHPWLLDATATRTPLGPNTVAYLEGALGALSGLEVPYRAKLEAIAVLSAVVTALTRTEITQARAGRTLPQWQQARAAYLTHVATSGQHPHLAAAFAAQNADDDEPVEHLFDRIVTGVLTGLLHSDAV